MKRLLPHFLVVLILLTTACTNPRWMVKDTSTIDSSDFTLISSHEFPAAVQDPTPEDPVLNLHIMSRQKYEYAQKVLMERYVQDYKMRPFFFSLGVMGAATAFYLANSGQVNQVDGRLETFTLNAVGGILALSTIFNFKPDGDPRATGEERFLRTTGTETHVDTTKVTGAEQNSAVVDIFYNKQTVTENQTVGIKDGQLLVDLGSQLSKLGITDTNPDSVRIRVDYADSLYLFTYPLTSILRPFARVETPVTELRNAPSESNENILADLVEGSQLQIVDASGKEWYKVLYGISENYVSRNDVSLVWRTSDFAKQHQVVAVPSVPFGRIDVENNIPILNLDNPNGIALLVGNEDYMGTYSPRTYTSRDITLLETYLDNSLGYRDENIYRLDNVTRQQSLDSVMTKIEYVASDSSDIFVYLSGYGSLQKNGDFYDPALLLTPDNDSTSTHSVNLLQFFKRLSELPSQFTVIMNNIDFSRALESVDNLDNFTAQTIQQPLYNRSITLTSQNDGLAILFSSEIDQSTHLYLGNGQEDKKHHIFPYYFARALQQRNSTISDLFGYLKRNVSYTARKLHDEPEDPVIFGNQMIDLAK